MDPSSYDELQVLRLLARARAPLSWYQVERALFPLGISAPVLLERLAEKGLARLEREEGPLRWFSLTEQGRLAIESAS